MFEYNIYWNDLDEEMQQRLYNDAIDEGYEISKEVLDSKEPVAVAFKGVQ